VTGHAKYVKAFIAHQALNLLTHSAVLATRKGDRRVDGQSSELGRVVPEETSMKRRKRGALALTLLVVLGATPAAVRAQDAVARGKQQFVTQGCY
jgi:hypothetical protein